MNNTLEALKLTLGDALVDKIQQCRILLVGAGGIGTELLKNLALSGFRHVTVIDLDTIDTSNLNRQLLFRSQHVGMPKCTVACHVAAAMAHRALANEAYVDHDGVQGVHGSNTGASNGNHTHNMITNNSNSHNNHHNNNIHYTAHHGNVCDNTQFNVQFVQTFDVVLNALDNVTARRRVNRLCLAAAVPLVEAGTTGYLGQANVIDKASNVACYECQTQETQKVYPICTIRSTPSMPVHTIVWAKELYKLLFAEKPQESMLYEDPAGEEPSTFMGAVLAYRAAQQAASDNNIDTALVQDVLTKFYRDEIQKQLDMGRYKTAMKTPHVLEPALLDQGCTDPTAHAPTLQPHYRQADVWPPLACVAELAHVLSTAAATTTTTVLPEFDKDDDLSMRFVTAASNLRSHVFGIEPLQSFYTAKGIAGNIIPASKLGAMACMHAYIHTYIHTYDAPCAAWCIM